jgi:hypothetical protein
MKARDIMLTNGIILVEYVSTEDRVQRFGGHAECESPEVIRIKQPQSKIRPGDQGFGRMPAVRLLPGMASGKFTQHPAAFSYNNFPKCTENLRKEKQTQTLKRLVPGRSDTRCEMSIG